jgi:hypothetical protein
MLKAKGRITDVVIENRLGWHYRGANINIPQ